MLQSKIFSDVKIVSGGQTGADRAGLDFALEYGLPCGGWCPKGRKAEDGPIPEKYPLRETSTGEYLKRTELNIIDSDGTVVFSIAPHLTGGSKKTMDFAIKHKKPVLHISRIAESPAEVLAKFIKEHRVKVLNVTGPRATKEPEVAQFVRAILKQAFDLRLE